MPRRFKTLISRALPSVSTMTESTTGPLYLALRASSEYSVKSKMQPRRQEPEWLGIGGYRRVGALESEVFSGSRV